MTETTRPHQRLGPRPLPVHLMAASGYYTSSIAASLALRNGSITWNPALREQAEELATALQNPASAPPESARLQNPNPLNANPDAAFVAAVEYEIRSRMGMMLQGIQSYRDHAYRRHVPAAQVFWREGTTSVLDYRGSIPGTGSRIPVLLIPSLVNRSYILDLREDRSLARRLSADGHPVFLIDWDAPGGRERSFALGDYIARLRRAVRACCEETGRPIAAIGYCMGGLLALAGSLGSEDAVDVLVVMATPWDFHAERPEQALALAALLPGLESLLAHCGELPTDVLQALFVALDPMLATKKFARFALTDPNSDAAEAFVALEDWLNDGVPLSAPVVRECFASWYGRNTPARGEWLIDGLPIDPAQWRKPALSLIPFGDRIVPPGSAKTLADAFPNGITLTPQAGHIGMVTARSAPVKVWNPLSAFLADPAGAAA